MFTLLVLLKFYVHEPLAEGVSKLWTVYLLQAINNFYQTPIIIYHNVKERLVFSRMTLKTLQIYNTPKLHCYIPLRFEHSVTINYNKLHYVPILSLAYTKKHHPHISCENIENGVRVLCFYEEQPNLNINSISFYRKPIIKYRACFMGECKWP